MPIAEQDNCSVDLSSCASIQDNKEAFLCSSRIYDKSKAYFLAAKSKIQDQISKIQDMYCCHPDVKTPVSETEQTRGTSFQNCLTYGQKCLEEEDGGYACYISERDKLYNSLSAKLGTAFCMAYSQLAPFSCDTFG